MWISLSWSTSKSEITWFFILTNVHVYLYVTVPATRVFPGIHKAIKCALESWFRICPFKMFLRVNLFVIISLYRVFLLRFGSEGMFQFLFHQQICLIHFFSQWWRQTNDPPFKPFLIDVGQNGEFINQNGCFYAKKSKFLDNLVVPIW